MARWRVRRPTRNESLIAGAVGLVIVAFVFFWVVKPWIWGRPAQSVVQKPTSWSWPWTKPTPPTAPGAVTQARPPVEPSVEQMYADFRALAARTAEQNGELIKQNSELVKRLDEATQNRLTLTDQNARLEERNKAISEANRTLRAQRAAVRRPITYPVATRVEYVGCPCPPGR